MFSKKFHIILEQATPSETGGGGPRKFYGVPGGVPPSPGWRENHPPILLSRFRTDEVYQAAPRGVRIPSSFSAAASRSRLVTPSPRSLAMTGRRRSACWSALRCAASTAAPVPFPALLSAAAPFGLPRRVPRALAAASASLVR